MNITELLLNILENPFSKKTYKDYEIYLKSIGKTDDAEAINYLISKRFNDESINSNIDKK